MAKMRPEDIAKWITEDVKPGETGVVAEALFGHVIKPSEKPIDLFIAAVDTNYLEWDQKDPRFQAAAKKFFGGMPTPEQWQGLFAESAQDPELLKKLGMTGTPAPGAAPGAPAGAAPGQFPTGIGLFEVYFKRGTMVKCEAFLPSNNSPQTYYMGIGAGAQKAVHVFGASKYYRRNPQGRPRQMFSTTMIPKPRPGSPHSTQRVGTWAYQRILTCNVRNIAKVVKVR